MFLLMADLLLRQQQLLPSLHGRELLHSIGHVLSPPFPPSPPSPPIAPPAMPPPPPLPYVFPFSLMLLSLLGCCACAGAVWGASMKLRKKAEKTPSTSVDAGGGQSSDSGLEGPKVFKKRMCTGLVRCWSLCCAECARRPWCEAWQWSLSGECLLSAESPVKARKPSFDRVVGCTSCDVQPYAF